MKKLLIGLGAVVILIAIALFVLVGNLDKIIKGALEGVGSELLGLPVAVQGVELDLKSGAGQITGLTIANPAGYSAPHAFQMDKIYLGLDLGSLGKQPLVINELRIASPIVELEAKEDGSSNLQTLLDNIEKNSAKTDKKAAEEQSKSEQTDAPEPVRISFKSLSITGVTVNTTVVGQEKQRIVIPDVVKADVGGAEGLTPSEVGSLIIGDIVVQSLKAALKKELSKKAEETTKGFVKGLKEKLTK